MDELTLAERRKIAQEKYGLYKPERAPKPEPDAPIIGLEDSDEDDLKPRRRREPDDISRLLDPIDILDAYRHWGGKGFEPNVGNKRENIMIRCPDPAHVDNDPSAWINLDEQKYCCGPCGFEGGDKYIIAVVQTTAGGAEVLVGPDGATSTPTAPVDVEPCPVFESDEVVAVATVTSLPVVAEPVLPSISWRDIVANDTF